MFPQRIVVSKQTLTAVFWKRLTTARPTSMRPFVLYGHDRPLTWVQFNREGDLVFTCAKDHFPQVWYWESGERIGRYIGHGGSVWHLDVDFHSKRLITGAADNTVKLWDVRTGKELYNWNERAPVRSVSFATGDRQFMIVTDNLMGNEAQVKTYSAENLSPDALQTYDGLHKGKIVFARFTSLNDSFITGGDDGFIRKWDTETGKLLHEVHAHTRPMRSWQYNNNKTLLISCSSDTTAKLFDVKTFELLGTYKTPVNVNAAIVSPTRDHVILGGGQEARDVTTTSARSGNFEARIFHSIFENEIGIIKGHFGPLNALAFSPDGKGYVSGGEEGIVRFHHFDESYHKLK